MHRFKHVLDLLEQGFQAVRLGDDGVQARTISVGVG
jgi:hypothetical protein